MHEAEPRVAIVTGGAGGIGSEISRALARDGLSIAICDSNMAAADQAIATLSGEFHAAFAADVTDEASVRQLFDEVESSMRRPTVLICVAGGSIVDAGTPPRLTTTTFENWVATEALNVRSTFFCVREYLSRWDGAQVPHGRIVTISSTVGLDPTAGPAPAYTTAKASVIAFSRIAALEAAPLGVTVNSVAPGMIDTPKLRARNIDAMFERTRQQTPSGRIGEPSDVAALVAFLVSPEAQHLTGCTIPINGGVFVATGL